MPLNDPEYLPLSYLSQMGYCPRRVGLLLNERIWMESADTAKGRKEVSIRSELNTGATRSSCLNIRFFLMYWVFRENVIW